ncbi:MAG TPA: TIGR01459 family HAD-type hydrolase [Kiloniellales bacterium]
MIPIYHGLSPLAGRYDAFIVDLWGVVHDGVRAFPEAVDCLARLHRRGTRILILSNAPRRAAEVAARSAAIGLPPHLCDFTVSSGEETWRDLAEHRAGARCYHLGPARDLGMRDGLAYAFVDDMAAADFILNTGALAAEDTAEIYDPLLRPAAARGVPMVCANPDLEVIRGNKREICAGAIAARYEAMGGAVRYHGKPHPGIYRTCFALLAGIPGPRIAAIGDSLRTDIAGAAAAGIDALFVTGGLQGAELGVDPGGNADPARLAALCAAAGVRPTAALPALRW